LREQQKGAGEAFFRGIEKLVDKVRFHAGVALKHIANELVREILFCMQSAHHFFFGMTSKVAGSMAEAVAMRNGEPLLMQASPTKVPGSSMAIKASFACLLTTVIFTEPDWIKETESAASHWVKIFCDLANLTTVSLTAEVRRRLEGRAADLAGPGASIKHD
jgi:hypothetical protein